MRKKQRRNLGPKNLLPGFEKTKATNCRNIFMIKSRVFWSPLVSINGTTVQCDQIWLNFATLAKL